MTRLLDHAPDQGQDQPLPGEDSPITLLARVDSTNTAAMQAARAGAAHGACWVADAQDQGRGRRSHDGAARPWRSPAGVNLYMSVLLRPSLEPAQAAGLTLAVAAHLVCWLRQQTQAPIWVKWPNDLYLERRKLAGILCEAQTGQAGLEAVVVGVGLNVNLSAAQLDPELRSVATSLLMHTGQRWDRLSLCLGVRRAILSAASQLERQGLGAVIPTLRALDRTAGCAVSWRSSGGQLLAGLAQGLDDDGQLIVVDAQTGQAHRMSAGEVIFDLSTLRQDDPSPGA